jgi:hypothetical protein
VNMPEYARVGVPELQAAACMYRCARSVAHEPNPTPIGDPDDDDWEDGDEEDDDEDDEDDDPMRLRARDQRPGRPFSTNAGTGCA